LAAPMLYDLLACMLGTPCMLGTIASYCYAPTLCECMCTSPLVLPL